ncbi:MAG: translocation/assembly module TamB [Pseudomonadota bacterium]
MARVLKYSGLLVVSVVFLIAFAVFLALGTGPGRARIADFVEPQLSAALGGTASIGRLGPGLPGRIVVEDVQLADDEGEWAFIDKATIGWRPIAYLNGETIVTRIAVDGAKIERVPNLPDTTPNNETETAAPPDLRIDEIDIRDVELGSSFIGTPIILDATGTATIDNGALTAQLKNIAARSADASPLLSLTGDVGYEFEKSTFRISTKATAEPSLPGLFNSTALPEGPISLDINADGTLDDFAATLNAATPTIAFGEASAPPLAIEAALAGLPNAPKGNISGADTAGRGALTAEVETLSNARIAVPSFSYSGPGFSVTGAGVSALNASNIEAKLAYRGEPGASPYPGVALAGAADIDARFEDGVVTASANAPQIAVNEISAKDILIDATGPLSSLSLRTTAEAIQASGPRTIDDLSVAAVLSLEDSVVAQFTEASAIVDAINVRLKKPATLSLKDGVEIEGMSVAIGEAGAIDADALLSPTRWRADIKAQDVTLPSAPVAADMIVRLDTNIGAANDAPIADGAIAVRSSFIPGARTSLSLAARWDGETLRITDTDAATAQGETATKTAQSLLNDARIDVQLPLQLIRTPTLSLSTEGPLAGSIEFADRIETLAAFVPTLESFEGDLRVSAGLDGTLAAPKIDGAAEITNAAYTEVTTGFSLTAINATAESTSTPDGSTLAMTASAAGAEQTAPSVFLTASAALGENEQLNAELELKDARFAAAPISELQTNGAVRLTGDFSTMAATGAITINRLNAEATPPPATGLTPITITGLNGDASKSDAPQKNSRTANKDQADNAGPDVALDISIDAPQSLFVRGRGLNSEWRAALRLTGTAQNPLLLGGVNVRRGTIDFTGRRFSITDGAINFDRLTPNNPSLNLRAAYDTGEDVVAAIVVGGRARAPSVSLESTPTLPREDIMALMLFGKPANELTAFESVQIAQALASLGGLGPFGGGGPGVIGSARESLGLDMLNVDFDTATGASALTVGKYVADGLFVSATQDAGGDGGAVRVEYELGSAFSVETELEQSGDQTVSANWKRDF